MSTPNSEQTKRQLIYAAASIAGLILLLVWMQGGFVGKTPPGTTEAAPGQTGRLVTARAEVKEIDDIMAWPGTVSARTVAQLAPKVSARIIEVAVKAGDTVKAGQVLAKLDQGEWQARL
ncbi:biotin/lipoyl-binding protein, partial [Methylogaea oryzae]